MEGVVQYDLIYLVTSATSKHTVVVPLSNIVTNMS